MNYLQVEVVIVILVKGEVLSDTLIPRRIGVRPEAEHFYTILQEEDFDRMDITRNLNDGTIAEKTAKQRRVNGGRHKNDTQLRMPDRHVTQDN